MGDARVKFSCWTRRNYSNSSAVSNAPLPFLEHLGAEPQHLISCPLTSSLALVDHNVENVTTKTPEYVHMFAVRMYHTLLSKRTSASVSSSLIPSIPHKKKAKIGEQAREREGEGGGVMFG